MSVPIIRTLADFGSLRTAPELQPEQRVALAQELVEVMKAFDWFTVGIMAPSADAALTSLRSLEQALHWEAMRLDSDTQESGPVFLKANQSTGLIRIRVEHGLGEGVLLSGHSHDPNQAGTTWGPLPLDFFA
jgi:hypothetical protein